MSVDLALQPDRRAEHCRDEQPNGDVQLVYEFNRQHRRESPISVGESGRQSIGSRLRSGRVGAASTGGIMETKVGPVSLRPVPAPAEDR
jgi:hypothetical protein